MKDYRQGTFQQAQSVIRRNGLEHGEDDAFDAASAAQAKPALALPLLLSSVHFVQNNGP